MINIYIDVYAVKIIAFLLQLFNYFYLI